MSDERLAIYNETLCRLIGEAKAKNFCLTDEGADYLWNVMPEIRAVLDERDKLRESNQQYREMITRFTQHA